MTGRNPQGRNSKISRGRGKWQREDSWFPAQKSRARRGFHNVCCNFYCKWQNLLVGRTNCLQIYFWSLDPHINCCKTTLASKYAVCKLTINNISEEFSHKIKDSKSNYSCRAVLPKKFAPTPALSKHSGKLSVDSKFPFQAPTSLWWCSCWGVFCHCSCQFGNIRG